MTYRFIEDIALAECSFEAKGKDLKDLFTSCADAFIDASVERTTVKENIKKNISIKANDIESLLFEFLEELVFIKDSDAMIFNKVLIKDISEKELSAVLIGDHINSKKQNLHADVKAITLHKFNVKKIDDGWTALVVMDI